MTAVDQRILSEWVNTFTRFDAAMLRGGFRRRNSELLRRLEALGVIRRVGAALHIECPYCSETPHVCDVVTGVDGRLQILCLENGRIPLTFDAVSLITMDRNALLGCLAVSAGKKSERIRFFADGRLALIGAVERPSSSTPYVLGYADGLEEENNIAGVIDALASQFPQGPGLIATPSDVPLNLPLPYKHRLIGLHELVRVDSRCLVIASAAVDVRLGQRKRVAGLAGRPTKKKTTRSLWEQLHTRPDWPTGRAAQVARVLADWQPGGGRPPACGTIEKHIRQFERDTEYRRGTRLRSNRRK